VNHYNAKVNIDGHNKVKLICIRIEKKHANICNIKNKPLPLHRAQAIFYGDMQNIGKPEDNINEG
jgi:hypothetical protein